MQAWTGSRSGSRDLSKYALYQKMMTNSRKFLIAGAYLIGFVLVLLFGTESLSGIPFRPGFVSWLIAWTPLVGIGFSYTYFTASPNGESFGRKVVTSAHGASITALYFAAGFVMWAGKSNSLFEGPWDIAGLIVLLLMIVSLSFFRGPKWLHLLQLLNLILLAETWFLGSMVITGNYL